ncbi:tlde1 domain-containing protein [Mesorhizobium sp. B4-1-1]|uniref:tlde1 domain-containing protein n=1 Tax=Mesorhizobium sp. B4-1-1 TaxID=2589890 RepID=UPI001FF05249|nr:tlde1 domain-containing protein [Mesorhizobium sp. B4-1-1]
MPAVGAALALWSIATLAGLYSVSTSLTAASNGLPQGLLSPRNIALGDQRRLIANAWAPRLSANGGYQAASLIGGCDAGYFSLATSFRHDGQAAEKPKNAGHDGKTARLRLPSPDSVAQEKVVVVASAAGAADRFDGVVKKAALSPQKLAEAFARAENAPFLLASLPSASRFGGALPGAPAEARFGSQPAEIAGASDLALALANMAPEDTADVPTAVALENSDAPDAADNSDNGQGGEYQVASLPPQDDLPDTIAVPGLRPRTTLERATEATEQSAAKPQKPEAAKPQAAKAKPQPAAPETAQGAPTVASPRNGDQALPGVMGSKPLAAGSKQGKRKAQASEMLAYAKPDTPERGGLGSAFRNLFNGPSTGNGVAVYDISARTVYMPDGSKLEAHSGLGSMVDQPRFVNRKNVGPTPPDTYNLSIRESRFHGVEAIRLTPTSGNNKYGRNGLLAHTYMLRGGRAESNGCVVFKDYHRFLAAYKKGKIKRLVVVPRLTSSPTQVAQEGRQG